MKSRTKKIAAVFGAALVLFVVFQIFSAGRGDERDIGEYLENPDLLYGTKITISNVAFAYPGRFEFFGISRFAQDFMEQNPGIIIEVREFDDIYAAAEIIGLELMAGRADTLVSSKAFDWRNPATARLFADWYGIMAACPDFYEGDWFMNVFRAVEMDGRLPILPQEFRFEIVAANNSIAGLPQAFAQYDFVTKQNLISLHTRFAADSGHFLHTRFNTYGALLYQLNSFIDPDSGHVNFQSQEFIDFINTSNGIANPANPFVEPFSNWTMRFTPARMHAASQNYLFMQNLVPFSLQFLFDFTQEYDFGGFAALLCGENKLLITHHLPAFALNAAATPAEQAAAWLFTQFIQNPQNAPTLRYFSHLSSMPVSRSLFNHILPEAIAHNFTMNTNAMLSTDTSMQNPPEYYTARIKTTLTTIANMPMRHVRQINLPTKTILRETMRQFHDNLIDARQAAEYLQNRITIVLMEME
ncbi:MAG: hypothetical protein FWB71_03120 [Defluviitaleaceae bacterium]|nr:hypothetical protein [Defluviitaleaceae bacterium]